MMEMRDLNWVLTALSAWTPEAWAIIGVAETAAAAMQAAVLTPRENLLNELRITKTILV